MLERYCVQVQLLFSLPSTYDTGPNPRCISSIHFGCYRHRNRTDCKLFVQSRSSPFYDDSKRKFYVMVWPWPKAHFYFPLYIFFLYFFFAFKCKEKVGKWAENPQILVPQRFPPAHFWKINGQKPTFLAKTSVQGLSSLQKTDQFKNKSGKVGRKLAKFWPATTKDSSRSWPEFYLSLEEFLS